MHANLYGRSHVHMEESNMKEWCICYTFYFRITLLKNLDKILARILKNFNKNLAISCQKSCNILPKILQYLAKNLAISCQESCKILDKILATTWRIVQESGTTLLWTEYVYGSWKILQGLCKILLRDFEKKSQESWQDFWAGYVLFNSK
jgi:hypothetical protein